MSEDLGQLVARVVADQAGFRSDMLAMARTVESNTAKMNASLSRISKASDVVSGSFRLITRVAGAFGVALSARAIFQFTTQTINAAAELQNLSVRLNASVESLSELQYVARLTDVDFQSFTQSLQIMTRNFGEASKGSKSMQDTFRQLGLDFRVLSGLPVDVQLEAVAEALNRVSDKGVQAALAQEVMGRGAAVMLQAMDGGAEGIRKLRQEARDLGAVISGETAESADEAKDAMDRLKASATGLATQLTSKLVPALRDSVEFWHQFFFPSGSQFGAAADAIREQVDAQIEEVERLQRLLANQVSWDVNATWLDRLIFPDQAGNIADTTQQLSAARVELDRLRESFRAAVGAGMPATPTVVPGLVTPEPSDPLQEITVAAERIEVMRDMERELTAIKKEEEAKRFATFLEFQNMQQEARLTVDTARLEHDTELGSLLTEQLRAQLDERLLIEQELTTAIEDHERIRLEAQAAAADKSIDITRQALQQELQWRELVANSAVGLLQALGAKHRGAAIAALAIQKGLALAEIKVQTEVAAMRALAELGPIAGPPVAAAIGVRGAISMGLVAATGLIEAAQLSSGGVQSTLGTSANPIATRSTSAGGEAMGSGRKNRVTEIHLHGDIYGWDDYVERRIIDGLRSAVNDREVVIINADSRQGELLGSTA